jgi:NTE family protein
MATENDATTVAIACQGGGSHTAFTAGVLTAILEDRSSEYEVTALTGTSGGAMCATLAWYGLRTGGDDGAATAVRLLDGFWRDLAARTPAERLVNEGVVAASRLSGNGFPLPQVSPGLNPLAMAGQRWLERTLRTHLDGPPLADLVVDPADAEPPLPSPTVLVSAVAVDDGGFDVFTDRPDRYGAGRGGETGADEGDSEGEATDAAGEGADAGGGATAGAVEGSASRSRLDRQTGPISVEAVLASAAVPPLFAPVDLPGPDGADHPHWDGLLAQNPPVRNLLTGPERRAEKPDEIWLVRINPTTREEPVTSLEAIHDRRNELAGSLSLSQELYFIEQVNDWLDDGAFAPATERKLKPVTVRQIELDEDRLDPPRRLVTSTKLDRDGGFVAELRRLGRVQAGEFLADRDADRYLLVE